MTETRAPLSGEPEARIGHLSKESFIAHMEVPE